LKTHEERQNIRETEFTSVWLVIRLVQPLRVNLFSWEVDIVQRDQVIK
jgi:hypothetical protein